MKKLLLVGFVGILFITANAQGPDRFGRPPHPPRMGDDRHPRVGDEKRAKIEIYKIQFITEKLGLTTAEAQSFWPVYNEHQKAVQTIIKAKMTDEIEFQESMLMAKKKYRNDLSPIFKSEDRVNEALKVEREFLKTIRFEMMKRRGINL